ncbi:hypothetical protein OB905_01865 [Halobacteria archaeon AArc-dxtr1]|nr:hypothetical protein [Halobacteria archaeon AArc-dxtr1]
MNEIVVSLDETAALELHTVDVGVSDGTIAFAVEGIVRNVDDEILEALTEESVRPSEIRFAVSG